MSLPGLGGRDIDDAQLGAFGALPAIECQRTGNMHAPSPRGQKRIAKLLASRPEGDGR